MVVRRVGQNNEAVDFKVNRARVSLVGQWLVNNHPGFQHHNVTFNQDHCNVLLVDGILGGLPEVEVDDFDVEDEGPIPREQHEEDDDLPPDHAFLEEHTLTAQRDDIVKGLNPTLWPDIDPNPINEFEFSGIASLAFVKLFPLGHADPTKKGRHTAVTVMYRHHNCGSGVVATCHLRDSTPTGRDDV